VFDLLFPNSSRCTVSVQDCLLGSMFGQVVLMAPVWLTPLMQGVGAGGGDVSQGCSSSRSSCTRLHKDTGPDQSFRNSRC
jgi:hypothetical protein